MIGASIVKYSLLPIIGSCFYVGEGLLGQALKNPDSMYWY